MKKKYVKPELEITEFEVEDVITTSGDNPTDVIDGDEDADEGEGGYWSQITPDGRQYIIIFCRWYTIPKLATGSEHL